MSLEGLKIRIKIHEGYRDTVYEDSLGKATIGYGHLVTYKDKFEPEKKYSKEMLDQLFGMYRVTRDSLLLHKMNMINIH